MTASIEKERSEWEVFRSASLCFGLTHPPTNTNLVSPDRPASNSASGRFARRACVTDIDAFISCCGARVGSSVRTGDGPQLTMRPIGR